MVNITTYQNPLATKTDSDKYCFRSVVDQTLDTEQLIKEIISYNSTITEADVRAVLSVLHDRVKHFVNLGYRVELPFGWAFLRANGTVAHLHDGFVPGTANHRISAVFKYKDAAADEMTKNASYRQTGTGYTCLPVITLLNSVLANGKESEVLTFEAGTILRIKGKHLSFDADDAKQGVFLISESKTEAHAVRYNRIGTNVVDAYIPQTLANGQYEVKIVTKPGTERYEKFVYSSTITVTGGTRG